MKKTFFTLIEGGKVRVAPETKVIPSSEIATLLEAHEIVEKIHGEADALREQVKAECDQIRVQTQEEGSEAKKQGYAAGFKEGQQEWVEHVAKLDEETKRVHKELREMVIPVALQAAKKIVGREMKMSPDTIVDIVSNNLRAVATHKRIILYVNKSDYEVFEQNKPRLKAIFEHLESLVIQERNDIDPSGCIIETEGGIINAQLENQWDLLQEAFESVMRERLEQLDETPEEVEEE